MLPAARWPLAAVLALLATLLVAGLSSPAPAGEAASLAQSTGSGPPIRTPTSPPIRVLPSRTPTPRLVTRTASPTPASPSLSATPTSTALPPSPTLPDFAILTPTPIVDVFDVPLDLSGPIPTATQPQFAAPQPVPDLIADEIEITQGMQDLDNHMPLAADRVTYVRIYVRTDGADYPDVRAVLQGSRGGQVLGVIPADNQPIIARGDGGQRINVDDSLYFALPWSWLAEGTLHLNAFVYAGNPNAPFLHEPESFNNFIQTSVIFRPGHNVNLTFIPIHLHQNYDSAQPEVLFTQQEPGFWPVVIGMLRHMPLSGFQLYPSPVDAIYCGLPGAEAGMYDGPLPVGQHGNCEFNLQLPGGAQYVNVMMALVDTLTDDAAEDLHYYGMVPPSFASQMTFYNTQGGTLSYSGLAGSGQAYGVMGSTPDTNSPWMIQGSRTLAHELGHRFGLNHVECSGSEEAGGAVDPGYPWPAPDCSLANVDEEGFFGFDVWHAVMPGVNQPTVISNDPSEAEPNRGFPLMGYQNPRYIDAWHWCQLLDLFGAGCDPDVTPLQASTAHHTVARLKPGSQAGRPRPIPSGDLPGARQQEAGPFLLITGVIQHQPLQASLDMVLTLPEPPADQHEHPETSNLETGFELLLLDSNGQPLAAQPIVDTLINHDPANTLPFLTGLPLPPGAARLVILYQGEILAERTFSQSVPVVEVLSPKGGEVFTAPFEIHWQASDPDGNELTYTLQYSPDGGQSWQVLGFGLTGDSFQVLSLDNLTGSEQGKIRVLASDGAHTGVDESDGFFSLPNTPPLPAIQAPAHLAVFPVGARVPISGSATDREDGVLPSQSLSWESSLDGFLDVGAQLEPTDLSPGYHVLTLTAEDSLGLTGQAQIGILVDPALARDVPDAEELVLASRILTSGADAVEVPQESPAPRPLALIGLGGVGILGLVLLGLVLILPLVRSLLRR